MATAQVAGRGKASAAEQQEARDLIKDMLSRGGEIQVRMCGYLVSVRGGTLESSLNEETRRTASNGKG